MIRIGIVGFGNLGRAVFECVKNFEDIKLVCIFTKRDLSLFCEVGAKFDSFKNIQNYIDEIDVMIMCGGSAKDLPADSPKVLKHFCVVDSFDTHAKIFEHYNNLKKVGEQSGRLALLSCGWDPGLFSLMRLLFESVSKNSAQTFWGIGVSQGHSDAIRKINGVLDARSYTIPNKKYIKKAKQGKLLKCDAKKLHTRKCFVVVKKGINKTKVANEIKAFPNYFEGYKTKVHFVSQNALNKKHQKLFHAGKVFGSFSLNDKFSLMEFSLKLESNPIFTACVLLSFARAVYKMHKDGVVGAVTVFDIPIKYLSNYSTKELLISVL